MSSNTKKRPALGKGLSALLESSATDITSKELGDGSVLGSVAMLKISTIEANPFNPRTDFDETALVELSDSIAQHGIIQPLTVRKLGRDKYQLISGERRFKASKLAGLTQVPAYIRLANDQAMLEMALVENIQREDLNAIEVALSYQRLLDECKLTQEELSKKLAKSRTSITNHIRLLKLPPKIQLAVRENELSMGHARALVSAGDEEKQLQIYENIITEQLSVRDVEALIKGETIGRGTQQKTNKGSRGPKPTSEQVSFANEFGEKVAAKIEIRKQPTGNG
ncbi:MAG: ParB/RepB/Spo0J family partition protein, partial [bacterium]|nr:ParB/RepB/Spo0J family partition protein [bacterium]